MSEVATRHVAAPSKVYDQREGTGVAGRTELIWAMNPSVDGDEMGAVEVNCSRTEAPTADRMQAVYGSRSLAPELGHIATANSQERRR